MGLRHASLTKMLTVRQLKKPSVLLTPAKQPYDTALTKQMKVLDPAQITLIKPRPLTLAVRTSVDTHLSRRQAHGCVLH